jgi:hypothetical protein
MEGFFEPLKDAFSDLAVDFIGGLHDIIIALAKALQDAHSLLLIFY